jgi:DNA mismatch repair ATPase MutL
MLNKNSVNFNFTAHKQIFLKNKIKKSKIVVRRINVNFANNNGIFNKESLSDIKFIGQFDNKFLIFIRNFDHSIIIFDQHAVHERVLYEFYFHLILNELTIDNKMKTEQKFLTTFSTNFAKLNLYQDIYSKFYLKSPISIDLKKLNINLNKFNLFDFTQINNLFYFEFIVNKEKDTLKLLAIPIIFDKIYDFDFYVNLFIKMIVNVENFILTDNINQYLKKRELFTEFFSEKIKSRACKDAVKFNEELDNKFILEMIECLKECLDPFLCAHGRHNFFLINKTSGQ